MLIQNDTEITNQFNLDPEWIKVIEEMLNNTKNPETDEGCFVSNFEIIKNYNTVIDFWMDYFKRWVVMLSKFIHNNSKQIQDIYWILHKYIHTLLKILNEWEVNCDLNFYGPYLTKSLIIQKLILIEYDKSGKIINKLEAFIKKYNKWASCLVIKIEEAVYETVYKNFTQNKHKDHNNDDITSDSEDNSHQVSNILHSIEHRKYNNTSKRKIKWFKKGVEYLHKQNSSWCYDVPNMKKFQIKITKHLRDEIDRNIFLLKQKLIEDKSNIMNERELEPEVQSKINLKLAPLNPSRLKVNKGVKTILNRIDTKTKMSSELNYNNLIVNKSNQFWVNSMRLKIRILKI